MEQVVEIDNFCFGQDPEEIIASILKSRGVTNVEDFLDPDPSYIKEPEEIPRMEEAAKFILDAIKQGKKFYLNVDSDTDGVTSGAIIKRYFKHCFGINLPWHISQGKSHGTSEALTKKLSEAKPDVLIIVDSLDSNVLNYKRYKNMGIDMVVLDHHDINPMKKYDDYVMLVSSNRSKNRELSGAGVCWKFCCMLDKLTDSDYAMNLVDLAATGIVADMMDVSEEHMENRAIIKLGINNMVNPAIKKIVGSFPFNSTAVSFSIAPLINACCRYSENEAAFEAFVTDDEYKIKNLLKVMRRCKSEQREEVDYLMEELEEQFGSQQKEPVLCGFIDTPNGVSGLVATKMVSKYHKPTLILKTEVKKDGSIRFAGSGRSIGDKDFRKACDKTGKANAFGHPKAFGVFVDEMNLVDFVQSIRDEYRDLIVPNTLHVDMQMDSEDITLPLIDLVKKVNEITGNGFPQIAFAVQLDLYTAETMTQGKHLVIHDDYFRFIQWNAGDLFEKFDRCSANETPITLIGTLDSGFIGRRFVPRMVVNNILVADDEEA